MLEDASLASGNANQPFERMMTLKRLQVHRPAARRCAHDAASDERVCAASGEAVYKPALLSEPLWRGAAAKAALVDLLCPTPGCNLAVKSTQGFRVDVSDQRTDSRRFTFNFSL